MLVTDATSKELIYMSWLHAFTSRTNTSNSRDELQSLIAGLLCITAELMAYTL